MDIVARWPGSSHDSTIFNASRARARFINREMEDDILLGDNGYACSNFLLTPLLQPNTQAQKLYNESHIRTRNVIERAFGVWKRRYVALAYRLRIQPLFAQAVFVSTAILHNIAQDAGEPDPPVDFDFKAALEELEIPGIHVHNDVDNATMRESLIDTHFSR